MMKMPNSAASGRRVKSIKIGCMYRVTSCPYTDTDIQVKKENEEKKGLSAFVPTCTEWYVCQPDDHFRQKTCRTSWRERVAAIFRLRI